MSYPDSSIIFRASLSFVRVLGMKLCPPNPGLTDMSKMMSILSNTYFAWSNGVAGLNTKPFHGKQREKTSESRDEIK